jgi:hypothetical protein
MLFGSMLANALKQLITLKPGHPAPCKGSPRTAVAQYSLLTCRNKLVYVSQFYVTTVGHPCFIGDGPFYSGRLCVKTGPTLFGGGSAASALFFIDRRRKERQRIMAAKKKAEKEKPLEKMTAKEMREIAMTISGITGVHGMNKEELLAAIKKERGIVDEKPGKKKSGDVRQLKQKIKALKVQRQAALEASDKKMATIYRRRISRLKKKTHRAS